MTDVVLQGTNSATWAGIPEMEHYSKKNVMMRHPGRTEDNLYYSMNNSATYPIECQLQHGKYIQNITAPNYGQRIDTYISNIDILARSYIVITMDRPTVSLANYALPRGWGNILTGDVSITFPSCDIPNITLPNASFIHCIQAECQTSSALTAYMRRAGEALANTDFNSPINLIPQDAATGKLQAVVVLDAPWSDLESGIFLKKGIDLHLMNAPIRITIQFNTAASIWGSAAATAPAFSAQFVYDNIALTNKALSLRNTLFREPGKRITIPSMHRQLQTIYFTHDKPINSPYNFSINQFIASDIMSLCFSVHLIEETTPVTANTPVNPINPIDIYNPRLEFGGEVLFYASGDTWKDSQYRSTIEPVQLEVPIMAWNGAAMAIAGSRIGHFLNVDLTQTRQQLESENFYNGVKYDSQTLNFSFNMAANYYYVSTGGGPIAVPTLGKQMVMYVTYFYPQVTSIVSGGGVFVSFN